MASVSVREEEQDGQKTSLYTFRIWGGQTGRLRHSLGKLAFPGFQDFDLSPDGKLLAIGQ